MADRSQRSVVATGGALETGGVFASAETSGADGGPALEESQGWSSQGGTAGNTRHVSSDGLGEPKTVAWQYDQGGLAAIVNGTVYLQTSGDVHALNANDGSPLWKRDGIRATGTPTVAGGSVYVSGAQLTALEASTGAVRWTAEFGTEASVSNPLAAFGMVYVTVDGTLRAFDAADGSLRWERKTVDVTYNPPQDDGSDERRYAYAFNTGSGTTAATDGTIWALLDERRNEGLAGTDALVELDPVTGETRWSDHLETGHVADGLTATEEALFIEDPADEGVIVFDIESREQQNVISDALMAATAGGTVVTQGRYGLTAITANSSWKTDNPYAFGALTIVDGTVIVANSNGDQSGIDELVGLDLEDGSERWQFQFEQKQWTPGTAVTCVVSDETIYVERNEGLTAVRPAGSNTGDESEESDSNAGEKEYSGGTVTNETDGTSGNGETENATANDNGSSGPGSNDGASNTTATTDSKSDQGERDDGNGADSTPGFTGVTGIAGGVLGLERLRRRATADAPNEEDA